MSADWFYVRRGGFLRRRKTIGPISENELLSQIEHGEILPETLIRSVSKTRNHWVQMRTVQPAMRHYRQHRGELPRD